MLLHARLHIEIACVLQAHLLGDRLKKFLCINKLRTNWFEIRSYLGTHAVNSVKNKHHST